MVSRREEWNYTHNNFNNSRKCDTLSSHFPKEIQFIIASY